MLHWPTFNKKFWPYWWLLPSSRLGGQITHILKLLIICCQITPRGKYRYALPTAVWECLLAPHHWEYAFVVCKMVLHSCNLHFLLSVNVNIFNAYNCNFVSFFISFWWINLFLLIFKYPWLDIVKILIFCHVSWKCFSSLFFHVVHDFF